MLDKILEQYNVKATNIEPFRNGLINHTWKVSTDSQCFILQKINHFVFKKPFDITDNIKQISEYLKKQCPDYLFVGQIPTRNNQELVFDAAHGYFRLTPFIENTLVYNTITNSNLAYQAAQQFGRFTKKLSGFDASALKNTIPDFHNLLLRYEQFLRAITNGNPARIKEAQNSIEILKENSHIVTNYQRIIENPAFKLRVMHHDTKISNVLFDKNNKGLCIIDLDTVMSGYFISDVGDMMRTYLSPVGEEEIDFSKIEVRKEFFEAIVEGYLSEMAIELTTQEQQYFKYAGQFMIYMQALRFLTDYLNNDVYYGSKFNQHNLMRAKNQIVLLERLDLV